ncbi:MFS transporter [Paenarthrobacter sp. NPDC089714]|uniref:MFS transporter n=1 Tax=Paenarthrobacter sp. NPDC089714 TaxID=3364377 RepID=UPI003808BBA1
MALVLAQLGVFITLMTPAVLTLALRVAEVFPDTKNASLAVVLACGALCATVSGPLFGSLSDRTTSKLGRRRPYLIAAVVGGLPGLLLMGLGNDLWVIVAGWCIVQLMMNASTTVIQTGVFDFIPTSHRARVSAFMGMTGTLSTMIGTWMIQPVAWSTILMFMVPFVPALVFLLWLIRVMPDRPAPADPNRPKLTLLSFLSGLWVNPFKYHDFGWATLNRFLVNMGFATFVGYQTYAAMDRFGLAADEAARLVAVTSTVIAVSVLVAAVPTGWLSDYFGRRKIFVAGAGVIMGIGLIIVGLSTSIPVFLIGASVAGIGFGLYLAIDLALITSTLPSAEKAATAMGFSAAMAVVPQSLAPALAPALLAIGGGQNYTVLFMTAAALTVMGCLAVFKVRSVR